MNRERRTGAWLAWGLGALGVALLGLAAVVGLVGSEPSVETILTVAVETLGAVSFPLVGAVIASRLPSNPYGWVWCALGIANGILVLSAAVAESGAGDSQATDVVAYLCYLALPVLIVFAAVLFPTGRLPGRRWRWLPRATVALGVLLAAATPFAPTVLDRSPAVWQPSGVAGELLARLVQVATAALLLLVLIAMASVIPRFRRARPVERQQLKWFVLAAVVNVVYLAVDLLVGVPDGGIWVLVAALVPGLFPVAIVLAVLKYRLYEIDRIVSRSVSYGLLTGGLALLYLGLVALLRPLLEPITGGSSLAVAASTLAVAAVFNPARRRLQAAVDRRFDRARYDAAVAVEHFAARLRDQVDVDQVVGGLRETVVATVAPARVTVWLRPPGRPAGVPR